MPAQIQGVLFFMNQKMFSRSGVTRYSSGRLSVLALVVIAVTVTWINFNTSPWRSEGGVTKHDIKAYYSYLPAAFIYKDLSFKFLDNDPEFFSDKIYLHIAPNGGRYQKTTMGLSFLYMPFFLAGHLAAVLSGAEQTGFSPPYMFFLQFSSLIYLLIGLLFVRRILRLYFNDRVVALVLLCLVFATNMLFYSTFEAAMSHVYSFALISAFLWLTIMWHRKQRPTTAIIIGIIFGLITLIRPTNGLVAVFFILYGIQSAKEVIPKVRLFLANWHQLLIIAAFALLIFIPQLIFWKINTGQWFFYSYGDEKFFFLQPNILHGLFSYRKGWLLYTPVMIFALIGVAMIGRQLAHLYWSVLVFTILNIYIVYSWWDWWYGGGLGSRPMIDSYALMSLPLAAVIHWWSIHGVQRFVGTILLFLLMVHGIFQTAQYHYGALHYMAMTKEAYWHSFGRIRPKYPFYEYLQYPDIMLARKGIQAVAPKSRLRFENFLECDYESVTDNREFFCTIDNQYLLSGVDKRSDKRARSGKYSILLSPENPFGSDIRLEVAEAGSYRLVVWRWPSNKGGGVAFTALCEDDFYNFSEVVSSTDANGWGRVELNVQVPENKTGTLKVYLWNPGNSPAWFDDLSIEKVHKENNH